MFKIPTPSGWWVVVTDSKRIDEIKNAYCANESQWKRYTSRFLKIIKSQNAYLSPCKHDSLSIAECTNTHFISRPLKQDLRNHYQHWSLVFMTGSSRPAINISLPTMECTFLGFLDVWGADSCLQNGSASGRLK